MMEPTERSVYQRVLSDLVTVALIFLRMVLMGALLALGWAMQ